MYQQSNNGRSQGSPSNRGGFNQTSHQYGQQYSQQQPYAAQQQYGQPGYQGGFQQNGPPNRGAHHSNTYPPPKRQKGNPVITRYAPPPGYQAPPPGQPWQGSGQFRGPTQGFQPPFQQQGPSFQRPSGPPNFQNGWQPQHGQFGGGPMLQSPQGYTPHSQTFPASQQQGPQSYPQQFAQQQGYQGQQQQQQHHAGTFNTGNFPAGQGQQNQSGHQQNQGGWRGSPPAQNGFSAKSESFGGSPHHGSPSRQGSGPHSGRGSVGSIGSMPPPPSAGTHQGHSAVAAEEALNDDQATAGAEPDPNDPLNMKEHDWTFDPEGAIWPKATEVVDSSLSLGLIAWHPGTRMTRAIPSTFAAAEQFARTAPPAPIGLGDSVSTYFMIENHENAYENISSLAHWAKVKSDPIFVSFPHEYETLPVAEVKEWRNRADVIHDVINDAEEEGEIGIDGVGPSTSFIQPPQQQPTYQSQSTGGQPHTRNGQLPSENKQPGLDQSQEDILASLGVEGPARPVYPTPGPAYGVQSAGKSDNAVDVAPQRRVSQASNSGTQGQGSHPQFDGKDSYPSTDDPIEQAIARAIAGNASPPQQPAAQTLEPQEQVRSQPEPYDPWNPDQGMPSARTPSPAPSNKTHSGSDFGQVTTEGVAINGRGESPPQTRMDEDAKPPLLRHESSASRKRSYDNFNDHDNSDDDHKRRQSGDGGGARRQSKTGPTPDDAYSRPW